jgi:macrolide-specific efflux system membrane fusion protein
MIPSTAITTTNGTSTVQIMKDGKPVVSTVEIGIANDSYTVIKSGVSEGDTVVTSTIVADTSTKDDATSLFSGTTTTTSTSKSSSSLNSSGGMPGGGMPGGF